MIAKTALAVAVILSMTSTLLSMTPMTLITSRKVTPMDDNYEEYDDLYEWEGDFFSED